MSLRWRLTAVIGGVVALMISGASFLAYVSADRQLNRQVDEFLVARSIEIEEELVLVDFSQQRSPSLEDAFRVGKITRPDAAAQLVFTNGTPLLLSEPQLSLSPQDLAIATGGDSPVVRRLDSQMIDDVEYRVLTSTNQLGALMVGRSVSEIGQTLDGLRSWLITISVFGSLAAALVGWLVANRVLRPVAKLAAATQQVAETQTFDADLRVETEDELGALATSFNSMLSALRASREQQHRLVRDANHELRTPLTSLRTNVDVMRRRGSEISDLQRDEIIEQMDNEVRELSTLVSELVEFATDASSLVAGRVRASRHGRTGRACGRPNPHTNGSNGARADAADAGVARRSDRSGARRRQPGRQRGQVLPVAIADRHRAGFHVVRGVRSGTWYPRRR